MSLNYAGRIKSGLKMRNGVTSGRFLLMLVLVCAAAASLCNVQALPGASCLPAQAVQQTATARPVGTIKSISGNSITLTTDTGTDVNIVIQEGARLVRVAPGQKDLNGASPLQMQDLQIGDRLLVRGKLADDGKFVLAASVIVIKKTDIAEKQVHEREEWQRHGVGGLVISVDASAGAIEITTNALGPNKDVVIHISKDTILRRYAPDSVKFDDAKPGPLSEIVAGDQLRARGTRSADGKELTADEIVSGSFRNIAGPITAMDPGASTISVQDLLSKKTITLKITADSQLRKLPPPMAQGIAMRLKGAPADTASNSSASTPAAPKGDSAQRGGSGGIRGGGGGDLQQAISRMPPASLADLRKGDAVMIVATQEAPESRSTVITLLGGVEPILEASPKNGASTLLSPWSLSSAPGGDAGSPQ